MATKGEIREVWSSFGEKVLKRAKSSIDWILAFKLPSQKEPLTFENKNENQKREPRIILFKVCAINIFQKVGQIK